jgi:hypothetical protein
MANDSPILTACIQEFEKSKQTAEAGMNQLREDQLYVRINPQQNSIAVIVQHMAGNMISRWTNFLTTDGEKPDRDRENEFADRHLTRSELMDLWNHGWTVLFNALRPLTDADLQRTITIRNEPHTVFQAINRQTAHYNLHLGQILLIAKHLVGEKWNYLTIPPGGSKEFNKRMGVK